MHLEMQMRRIWRRIPRRPHIAQDVAAPQHFALFEPFGIAIQMGVVIAKLPGPVELINRQPSPLAGKELHDLAFIDRAFQVASSTEPFTCNLCSC